MTHVRGGMVDLLTPVALLLSMTELQWSLVGVDQPTMDKRSTFTAREAPIIRHLQSLLQQSATRPEDKTILIGENVLP